MITGDHLNIAKETARLIGMGVNIHAGEETRIASPERNDLIWNADGFAQVMRIHYYTIWFDLLRYDFATLFKC